MLFAPLLFVMCLWPPLLAAETPGPRDPRAHFFTQTFGDLPEELAEAGAAGKIGLFLFFQQEGCAYCRRMLQTVLSQPRVQDWYAERFLNVAVDIRGDVELTDFDGITLPSKVFAQHRKIMFTPVMSFLDLYGVEVFRKAGMVADPEEFLLMGEYVATGRYTDTPYTVFLAEKGYEPATEVLKTPAPAD